MSEKEQIIEKIQRADIAEELQESYLDYAMSVIVSRALPDARDGLKPVHRRILYTMWENGLRPGSKFRKSAAVVGEVLKSLHPHGDSSVYDALVRMVQDFSLRYPLIEGQGNFGSVDGDSAAAYRYTEAKLARISEELLTDIEKETVDWMPNYDASTQEPKVLPAKLPNLLLNGAMGIAVGMATNIPPHNLGEVADAIIHLAEHPDSQPKDLVQFVKGPDFPTGGIIYDKKAIEEAYVTGRGAITIRAVADIEERKNTQFDIIITEIPYQVNKSELITRMAELVQEKKIEGIRDLRDESDRDGLRIVVELKNDAPPQKILNQLYQYTDLQKDFYLNLLALDHGIRPQIMSLKDVLEAYLEHRKIVVRRRTEYDLKKAEERAHILEGLVKALNVIDKIIATIKASADKEEAHKNLVKKFKLSDLQTTAILEMKLQSLAALERKQLEAELKEKRKIIEDLRLILKNPKKITDIIKNEVIGLKEKYGDERRTKVVSSSLKEFREEDLTPKEETLITLSQSNYIKRLKPETFKVQRRGGKGLIGFDLKEEDFVKHFLSANTHDNILFFTDQGRAFQTKVYEIPQATRTSKGKIIHNFLDIPAVETISAIIAYPPDGDQNQFLMMVTKNGLIKKVELSAFAKVRRTGIMAIKLKKGDALKSAKLTVKNEEAIITSAKGQAIRFKESDIRSQGRNAAGVRGIRLKTGDSVSSLDIIKGGKGSAGLKLLTVMAKGFAKQSDLGLYKLQSRGGQGIKTAKVTDKTGEVIATQVIKDQEEIMALSGKGQVLRTKISSIRLASRATQGVRIMNLKTGDKLVGVITL